MTAFKVYIATSLRNADEAAALQAALLVEGIEVTYPWWTHGAVWDACPECFGGSAVDCPACKGTGRYPVETSGEVVLAQQRCARTAALEAQGVRDADLVIVILCEAPAVIPCNHCNATATRRMGGRPVCDTHGYPSRDLGPLHPLPSVAAAQRGTHTELGLAIAYGKPVLIFASSASRFASNATCAFYFHPAVRLRRVLKQEETRIAVMEACVVQHFASLSVQQTGPDFTYKVMDVWGERPAKTFRDIVNEAKDWTDMPNWKQDLPGEAPPVKDAELTHWMESGSWFNTHPVVPKYPGDLPGLAPARADDLGFSSPPARYSDNPDGKETIDRMFEEAERVFGEHYVGIVSPLYDCPGPWIGLDKHGPCEVHGATCTPFDPVQILSLDFAQPLRAALCAAIALKYEDRAGKKGPASQDLDKAAWFRQMQQRWEKNDPSLDPRSYRAAAQPAVCICGHDKVVHVGWPDTGCADCACAAYQDITSQETKS